MWLKRLLSPNRHKQSGYSRPAAPQGQSQGLLFPQLELNADKLKQVFRRCSDVVFRYIDADNGAMLLVFIDGMADTKELENQLIVPIYDWINKHPGEKLLPNQLDRLITATQISHLTNWDELIDAVLSGDAVLLTDGSGTACKISAREGKRRGVEEPPTEVVIRGPREGFTESLRTNTALVRFRIKSSCLRMEHYAVGEKTKTDVVLSYMDDIADPAVIEEVRSRIRQISIDGVLESGYIEELIEDEPFSPFPQLQYTERPDTVAAQLLEGRFAIFIDGTPFVLNGPITFWQMMQASEDYYERFWIGSFIRWLRVLFLFFALFLPALYIAITTFHQDMLPSSLLLSISAARETIPFPALIEALIMEVSFEALREAGIRLPKTVGQAVSILGALVIGQSAVEAGIVSAPMVIVVSMTGIASFAIPRFNFAIAIRLLRFPLMVLAGIFGLFGIVIGTLWIAVHLCHLRSFGVPYLSGYAPLKKTELKDILFRAPRWALRKRPSSIQDRDLTRMPPGMKPSPPDAER